jgi:hypothetical protein
MQDGIHLTNDGDQKLADLLYECFRRNGILRPLP